VLTGQFKAQHKAVNLGDVIREIDDARDEEVAKRMRMQQGM
jgi:RIO kinase 1